MIFFTLQLCIRRRSALRLTEWDMGRLFVLPMPGDPEWTRMYLVEYLRPCTVSEVPDTDSDCDEADVGDFNITNSSCWRSHQQSEIMCPLNVVSGRRIRKKFMPFAPNNGGQSASNAAKSMLRKKSDMTNVTISVIVRSKKMKGKWHVIHFLGNDHNQSNMNLPKTSPVFHRAFESVNSFRNGKPLLLFSNVREQCKPYTGVVQDADFELGTEVFDDGELPLNKGKRLTQESWDR